MASPATNAEYRIPPMERPSFPRVRAALMWCRSMAWFVRAEVESRAALPLARRVRGWRHGFGARSYVLYDLDAHDLRDYLSDYAMRFRSDRLRGAFNDPVRNKLAFARAMTLHGFRHARVRAVLDRGRVHDLDAAGSIRSVRDWLAQRAEPPDRTVLKPIAAGGGQGIIVLDRGPAGLSLNDLAISLDHAERLLTPLHGYLITELVVQARYAAAIYPGTTNTVRILTFWDPAVDRPFIAAAAHRIGTARSAPLDNFHGGWGGLSARIDLDTGVLGPGATLSDAGRLCWHERHPESGAPIAGVRVEGWPAIAATVLDATRRLPEAPVIGWDVIVTDQGCCFLEGNAPPGIHVWQVHGPLLTDPRVRRFYETRGLIRDRAASTAPAAPGGRRLA
jgi:hypothetical protein